MMNSDYKVGANILLVEDDESYGKALKRLLADECNVIEQVNSCEDAASSILGRELYFDVIILDHGLAGGQTGLECLRTLKSSGLMAEVIVLTGRGSRALGVEMIREGAFRYFTKQSENDDELIAAIEVARDLVRTRKGYMSSRKTGKEVNSALRSIIAIALFSLAAVILLNLVAPDNFSLSILAICALVLVLFFSVSGVRKFQLSWKEGGKEGELSAEGTAQQDHRTPLEQKD